MTTDATLSVVPANEAPWDDLRAVFGTRGDPVTPVGGAVDMATQLLSGTLLTWEGNGHTAYPKTDCVTASVNAYLIDLVAPLDGLTCPA